MIKLTMTVDNESVDSDDLIRALNANAAYLCIDEIHSLFRGFVKHEILNSTELTEDQVNLIDAIWSKISEITSDLPCKF